MKKFPLEPIETASPKKLQALQLERLRWSLKHAYDRVPHYRRKFDAAGVKPHDCRSLADLAKFPFTTKADLRDTYPFGMFAVPMDKIVRIHASSGTTGKPTVVGYTAKDLDTWSHLMARSIRAAGARPGDKVHVAYGYGLFTGGLGAHYGAERLGLAVIPLGGGMTERQVQLIPDFKPDIIMVTPSYMLAIADEMQRQGLDPRNSSLRVGIFGAEPWTNELRRSIEAETLARSARPLRAVGGHRPGRGAGMHRDQGRPHLLGGPLLSRDRRPGERRAAARRREGRAGPHLAHQGSAAGDPLPHARPDAPAARHRAQHAPHGEDHRPLRRHADHPRRQRVPFADRGADPQAAGLEPALRARAVEARPARPPHRAGRRRRKALAGLQHEIKSYIGISADVQRSAPSSARSARRSA